MPPSVARELVATSGPKQNPSGRRNSFNWSSTTPAPNADRAALLVEIPDLAVVAREINDQTVADGAAAKGPFPRRAE